MSVTLPKLNVSLPKPLEGTAQPATVQGTTPAQALPQATPAVTEGAAQFADQFQNAVKQQQEWIEKYAAGGTGQLTPEAAQTVADLGAASDTVTASVAGLAKQVNNAVNAQKNVVAGDQVAKGGWKDAPVVKQTEDNNCGEAAATMLSKSKTGTEGVSAKDKMDELKSKYATDEGTTPEQMTKMLAHEGVAVKKGDAGVDKAALTDTLHNGGKAVAMVDSNKLDSKDAQAPGKAHWVVIDGMDDQGRFMVKDPAKGTSKYVDADELAQAVDTSRQTHQSGGVLTVENASGASEDVLAEQGKQSADVLGNTPGGGSYSRNSFGRESS